ncbi:MAG: MFS transporter [Alphaproteobacteria bacterium]
MRSRFISQLHSKTFFAIPAGIWALGIANFFMNVSSILVFTFTPLFLKNTLGAAVSTVGAIEAVVESSSLFIRIFSGVISDVVRRRKALIGIGYFFSVLARIALSFSGTPSTVTTSRIVDRISNGIQATPRDALVADLAPPEARGRCYGLRHALTVGGSLVGSALGVFLASVTGNNYRFIFWFSVIPAAFAFFVVLFGVYDRITDKKTDGGVRPSISGALAFLKFENLSQLPTSFWKLMVVAFLFMTGNFTGSFLIYAAEYHGTPGYLLPMVMVVQNVVITSVAFYFGKLSDRFDRRLILALGIVFLVLECLTLGFSFNMWTVFLGVGLCGLEMGITQSPLLGLVTDNAPEHLRGTAFGVLHLVSACAVFISNLLMGHLWEISPKVAFSSIAILSSFALVGLCFVPKSGQSARMASDSDTKA